MNYYRSLAGALVGAHCGVEQIRTYIPRIEDGEVAMQLAHAIAEVHTAN